jgi:hypothetical protein
MSPEAHRKLKQRLMALAKEVGNVKICAYVILYALAREFGQVCVEGDRFSKGPATNRRAKWARHGSSSMLVAILRGESRMQLCALQRRCSSKLCEDVPIRARLLESRLANSSTHCSRTHLRGGSYTYAKRMIYFAITHHPLRELDVNCSSSRFALRTIAPKKSPHARSA